MPAPRPPFAAAPADRRAAASSRDAAVHASRPVTSVRRLALLLAVAVLAALAPSAAAGTQRVLLPADAPLPSGARVLQALPVADVVLVEVLPGTRPAGAVDADTGLGWRTLAAAPDAHGLRLDSSVTSTGAPQVWRATTGGERAVVALIDTGVAPVPALEGAVAGEIDFTGTGGGDGYGHGTFLASLIAGRGPLAPGVAPAAGVLSLKVGGPDGDTTLGTVLAALDWLHGPGRAAGLTVAAMALGVEPGSQAGEVLDRAVDKLAVAGVLVVVASGNDGPDRFGAPATAPGAVSVGSMDDRGTAHRSDDVVAEFSGKGTDRAGEAQPTLHASGVAVVGAMPADSVIARQFPDAVVEGGLFRGSGTSMSTALAAGVAALASSARPDLDGKGLERALHAGGGELDAPAAVEAALAAPAGPRRDPGDANPSGPWPGAGRGTGQGKASPNGKANGHADSADPQAVRWRAVRWRAVRWRGQGWGDADWDLPQLTAVRWKAGRWADDTATLDSQAVRWAAVRWKLR